MIKLQNRAPNAKKINCTTVKQNREEIVGTKNKRYHYTTKWIKLTQKGFL